MVGAGVAGLAAAQRLRACGIGVTVLEAAPRIGGRAWTSRPTCLGGGVFDHGAAWLHAPARNPLVDLAEPEDGLFDADAARTERLFAGGAPASPDAEAAYRRAWDGLETAAATAARGADVSLAEAASPMAGDPWAPAILLWEGAIIAAADADELSVQDWRRNMLEPPNLAPPAGVGAFIARHLAGPVELGTSVTRIAWNGRGVRADTARGTVHAAAAIVTVSTGVLASGAIGFDPALPVPVQHAIHALPMGLLTKVALPGAADRLGLGPDSTLVQQDGRMVFNAWPHGREHVIGFMGGRLAWSFAGDAAAAEEFARAELRRMLGGAARLEAPGLVTGWGADPNFLGAYAFARPGDAGQRGALAAAFPGERMLFAGEASRMDGLAGTVGGAYLSGREAAERLMQLL